MAHTARSKQQFSVVLADWKDVDGLLSDLKEQLRKFGVVMQQWDVGTDDYVLTVSGRRVKKAEVAEEMQYTDEDPVDVSEVK